MHTPYAYVCVYIYIYACTYIFAHIHDFFEGLSRYVREGGVRRGSGQGIMIGDFSDSAGLVSYAVASHADAWIREPYRRRPRFRASAVIVGLPTTRQDAHSLLVWSLGFRV